jgi:hypothetical protein
MMMKAVAGIAGLQLLSCGGGNSNPCPTGSCDVPGRTVIKYQFDHYPQWLFESDTCIDMGAVKVHIDAIDVADPANVASVDASCSDGQGTLPGLAPGTYNVAVTPIDGDGNSLVKAPSTGQVVAADVNGQSETTVDVPYTAWSKSYTGTLLFRLAWGGMSCEVASPHVATQTLTLTSGGSVIHAMTDTGQLIDGTDPKPCRPLSEQFAQFVTSLPFGPVTLLVVGKDGTNAVAFEHQFDTFVGAGSNNPTIELNVPPPDAALDAPAADAPADDAPSD